LNQRPIDQELAGMLNAAYRPPQSPAPHKENRVFVNRNLRLAKIEAIGFDMDYTLVHYKQEPLEKLTMKMALKTMVQRHGYHECIAGIDYDARFAMRGLAVDTANGNVLKMDKFRYVSLAYHGLTPLSAEQRHALYYREFIDFDTGRFRVVDTLFDLLETYLYAAIVDCLEKRGADFDCSALYRDLRASIDLHHRDGSLKREMMAHPERYIHADPNLAQVLHQFKSNGKKLFVVTNSEPHYTDFALSYIFGEDSRYFANWRDCFDIVCASAMKPRFFKGGGPPEIIEDEDGRLFFSGGDIAFLQERLDILGDRAMYVGDHLYGDLLKSRHSAAWRTCFIVPELEGQIVAERQALPDLRRLAQIEARRKDLDMELAWLRGHLAELDRFRRERGAELAPEQRQALDDRLTELQRQTAARERACAGAMRDAAPLRRRISDSFNPYWGRLFKAGGQISMFAEQIRDYACIYTSSVNNFAYYGDKTYWESAATPMPHEETLVSVGDVDFDTVFDSVPVAEPAPEKT